MDFDLLNFSVPYDPVLHSQSVSTLKEYGTYYQITVSKMINDLERVPMSDMEKSLVKEGLTRSDARFFCWCMEKNCLHLFGSDFAVDVVKPDHVGRFINNIYRARKTLDELGNCNQWDYFVTLTIDSNKYDRYDFKSFYKVFAYFLGNCKRDSGFKLKYVFVPEQHQDGAWHLHGLVSDIPLTQLTELRLQDFFPFTEVRIPQYILDKLGRGDKLYNWGKYADKFGFCLFEQLEDSQRASSYISKYIGKGFIGNDKFKNVRLLLPSLGLNRAVKLKKGFTSLADVKPNYDCEYATIFKFDKSKYSLDSVLKYFTT